MERTYSVIVSNKEQSWSTFVAWCEAHKLCPAPAHPWTVAAYLRSLEGTMRLDAIRRHLAQVGRMHFEKVRKRPDRHPLVERTLASMRQRSEAASLRALTVSLAYVQRACQELWPSGERTGTVYPFREVAEVWPRQYSNEPNHTSTSAPSDTWTTARPL